MMTIMGSSVRPVVSSSSSSCWLNGQDINIRCRNCSNENSVNNIRSYRTLTVRGMMDLPGQVWNCCVVMLVWVLASSSVSLSYQPGGGAGVHGLPVAQMQQGNNAIGCIWRSSISPTMPREQVFTPRSDCIFGQLRWYQPHPGYILRINFRYLDPRADFKVCLQHHDSNYITRAHRKNDTLDTLIKLPEKGKETCLSSEDHLVEVYFEAPSHDVHVTVIPYHTIRQPP